MELASLSKILERLNDCPARDLESQSLEFKGWCKSEKDLSHEIGEAAVCLANTVGGLIIVGVDDKNTGAAAISPCPHPSLTVDLVKKWIWDLTKPPVECNVVRLSDLLPTTQGLPMGDLFIVEVQKTSHASGHRTTRGVSLIRIDKECRPEYFTEKDDYSALCLERSTLGDLSEVSLRAAISHRENRYPDVKRLGYTGLDHLRGSELVRFVDEGQSTAREATILSIAALLFLGREERIKANLPSAETVFVIQDSPVSPLTSSNWYNLEEAIRRYLPLINQELAERRGEISENVIRELLLNAYLHRCYRTPGPVQILLGAHELEIRNPGGLLGTLTPETLLYEPPQYRNFLLVDAARQFGYCEKAGSGIDKVYYQLIVDGLDFPIFESGSNSFKVIIKTRRDAAFAKFMKDFAGGLNLHLTDLMTIRALRSRTTVGLAELAKLAQRSEAYMRDVLTDLERRKIVNKRADGRYALADEILNQLARYDESGQLKLFPR